MVIRMGDFSNSKYVKDNIEEISKLCNEISSHFEGRELGIVFNSISILLADTIIMYDFKKEEIDKRLSEYSAFLIGIIKDYYERKNG